MTAFNRRRAIARCLVYDLERERTRQAFVIRELQRSGTDTAAAQDALATIGEQLQLARAAVAQIESQGAGRI